MTTAPIRVETVGGSNGFVASYFDNDDLKFVKQIGRAGSESALGVVQGGIHFYVAISGDGNDVITCLPETLGSDVKVSACTLRFDGGANGFDTLAVDNIAVGRSGMVGTDFSDEEENTTPDEPDRVDGAARSFLPLVTR